MEKFKQICSLVTVLLIIASLAIVKHGQWMGHSFKSTTEADTTNTATADSTLHILADGTAVINTQTIGKSITGYAGNVPLEITIKNGKIIGVKALENEETEDFFYQAASLLDRWNGKTIDEALAMQVDAVSGATFSSKAIIANMQQGLAYAKATPAIYSGNVATAEATSDTGSLDTLDTSAKGLIGLAVVLMAALLPLVVKNRKYHLFQLGLNVIVLGFWCGAFISYTSLTGYMAHGINILSAAIPVVMLVTAFVYPLFGKKTYYCTHVCPFGSLQQLAGTCTKHKIKMGTKTLQRLDMLRQAIWTILMLCIWSGVWSQWMDYEPFSAFIFQSASWVVIALAGVFVLLSFVVSRPYCRFVCPVGTLLKASQSSK